MHSTCCHIYHVLVVLHTFAIRFLHQQQNLFLHACPKEYAEANGFKGVAAVTSSKHWLIDAGILEHHGYRRIASAPPSFDLMVLKFDPAVGDPRFCGDWERKLSAKSDGLVVYRSGQCPYLDDAVLHAKAYADEVGIAFEQVELRSAEDVRRLSPTPYGVFALVLNGKLLSYNYELKKDIAALAAKLAEAG